MALDTDDDVVITSGDTTFNLATDVVSGKHYQYVKHAFGADGTATLVSSSNPFPVTVISAATQAISGAVTVTSGTVAVSSLPALTLDLTGTTVGTELTTVDVDTTGATSSVAAVALVVPGAGGGITLTGDATYGLDMDVTRMPPAARITDSIAASMQTDAIMDGLTARTPKFAAIAPGTSGNNTLVAAVASRKIRVLALSLMSNGSVNAKFQSGASGTDLTGLYYMAVNTGIVLPFNPVGWFETAVNTLLNANLSGTVATGGSITYVEVA